MRNPAVSHLSLPQFSLWDKTRGKRIPLSIELEITARCNNNCRHCYINLPAGDRAAGTNELSFEEIKKICDEAVSLGTLWCLITGGEPLLREDFFDIYNYLKKKGLLVSIFTNATRITEAHVRLFKNYPPRELEVSVYGVTKETYEKVTRTPGSFSAFMRGLDLLMDNGVKVTLKAMVLRSNIREFPEIARFCRKKTGNPFRFDPFLHLRFDGNPARNAEITLERLSAEDIVALERSDPERSQALQKACDKLITSECNPSIDNHLFGCNTGNNSLTVGHDGKMRLCSSLWHPECLYDLKKGSLAHAWHHFIPEIRNIRSSRQAFMENCRECPLINLCMWCPAHAHLETGELDIPVDYFCKVAHARAKVLRSGKQE